MQEDEVRAIRTHLLLRGLKLKSGPVAVRAPISTGSGTNRLCALCDALISRVFPCLPVLHLARRAYQILTRCERRVKGERGPTFHGHFPRNSPVTKVVLSHDFPTTFPRMLLGFHTR